MHSVYLKGPEQSCQTLFFFGPQIRPRSLLTMLLWLPVEQPRIEFCLLCFSKIISDQTPIYFSYFPQLYTPSQQLHLLLTLECSEYHPSALSPAVNGLFGGSFFVPGSSYLEPMSVSFRFSFKTIILTKSVSSVP